jgi:CDP-diacylglycerol--glycerol-3-phosphate 3-phosphatidyltransferase
VDVDTLFWPVIQAGVLGIKEEEEALGKVMKCVGDVWGGGKSGMKEEEKVVVDLTSGYFGLYKSYKKAIVESQTPYRIIAASPRVSHVHIHTYP